MRNFKVLQKSYIFIYIAIFLFFLFAIYCSPLSNDDYEFLSLDINSINNILEYVLYYGNGRVLGNLCSITFVRMPVFSLITRTLMLSSLVMMIPHLLDFKSTTFYIISFVFFTLLDPVLFGEVYLWASGFWNYIPPIWITTIILLIIKQYPFVKTKVVKLILSITILILGFSSQLFVEHSTIINLFLSLSLTLFSVYSKNTKYISPLVLWTFGTILGCITMFSVPIIFYIDDNRSSGYRHYNLQSLSSIIKSCAQNILMLGNHYSGMNSIPLCIGALSSIYLTKDKRSSRYNHILLILNFICAGYLLIATLTYSNNWYSELGLLSYVFNLIIICIQLISWFICSISIDSNKCKYRVWFTLFMALFSLVPLFVVSPIPDRTVFHSYVFLSISSMLCVYELVCNKQLFQITEKFSVATAVIVILYMSPIFFNIKMMADVREKYITQQLTKGASEIIVYSIPYPYTSWDTIWCFNYHFYREEKEDTIISTTEFLYWMNDYYPYLD